MITSTTMIYLPWLLLLWLYFCVLVGVFARHRRNRFGLGYGLTAVLFSPLLTFPLVACLRTLPEREHKPPRRLHGGMPGWRDPVPNLEHEMAELVGSTVVAKRNGGDKVFTPLVSAIIIAVAIVTVLLTAKAVL